MINLNKNTYCFKLICVLSLFIILFFQIESYAMTGTIVYKDDSDKLIYVQETGFNTSENVLPGDEFENLFTVTNTSKEVVEILFKPEFGEYVTEHYSDYESALKEMKLDITLKAGSDNYNIYNGSLILNDLTDYISFGYYMPTAEAKLSIKLSIPETLDNVMNLAYLDFKWVFYSDYDVDINEKYNEVSNSVTNDVVLHNDINNFLNIIDNSNTIGGTNTVTPGGNGNNGGKVIIVDKDKVTVKDGNQVKVSKLAYTGDSIKWVVILLVIAVVCFIGSFRYKQIKDKIKKDKKKKKEEKK